MPEIKKKQLQGRRTMLGAATLSLAFSAGLWFTITGCSPQTGGRSYNASITSNVGGLRAYAIPHRDWLKNGQDAMLEDEDRMSRYVLEGYTNPGARGASKDLKGGRYIFVVQKQGQWEKITRELGFRKPTDFEIYFPEDSD